MFIGTIGLRSSGVERSLGKGEAAGSIPAASSRTGLLELGLLAKSNKLGRRTFLLEFWLALIGQIKDTLGFIRSYKSR